MREEKAIKILIIKEKRILNLLFIIITIFSLNGCIRLGHCKDPNIICNFPVVRFNKATIDRKISIIKEKEEIEKRILNLQSKYNDSKKEENLILINKLILRRRKLSNTLNTLDIKNDYKTAIINTMIIETCDN